MPGSASRARSTRRPCRPARRDETSAAQAKPVAALDRPLIAEVSGSRRVAFGSLEPRFRGLSERSATRTVGRVWTPGRAKAFAIWLAVAAVALGASGCAFNPDPTEDNFDVRVTNDTLQAVILSTCGTGNGLCRGKTYQTGEVAPGDGWSNAPTSVGQINPILVRSAAGRRLGCLPLYYSYNAHGTTVRVSDMVPCRKDYAIQSPPAG
jgi:hypothetical protein